MAQKLISDWIEIKGARVHNLQNLSLKIPRNKLVVITGVSGSGKSSLAFDTIYAEGQRRYVESLSVYARQFLEVMDKPEVESIEGLSPAIAISQKMASYNPRSTVGTVTEIYDYLRLLFARAGVPYCPNCNLVVSRQSVEDVVAAISKLPKKSKFYLMAPIVEGQAGSHLDLLTNIQEAGFVRVLVNQEVKLIADVLEKPLDPKKRHHISVVVDRLQSSAELFNKDQVRLRDSIEATFDLGNGLLELRVEGSDSGQLFSLDFSCPKCRLKVPPLELRSFSFNSPVGACDRCAGLGEVKQVSVDLLIPNKKLSLAQGGIRYWSTVFGRGNQWLFELEDLAAAYNFSTEVPISELSAEVLDLIFRGTEASSLKATSPLDFSGVANLLEARYLEGKSGQGHSELEQYLETSLCPVCDGQRLKEVWLSVKIGSYNIYDITQLDLAACLDFFDNEIKSLLTETQLQVVVDVIKEIRNRLGFLSEVGLDYLTLDRSTVTLSGGESQRIRLATQIGSSLMGVIYILDEPSVGLHQRDNNRLIESLIRLRDLGNTVIVVEHDQEMMEKADYLIDIGPGAGVHGGQVVAAGTPAEVMANPDSATGQFLKGALSVSNSKIKSRRGNGKSLVITGATENNLKKVKVRIPLAKLVCVTGVSGSGKSSLINRILVPALTNKYHHAKKRVGKHVSLEGAEHLDKIIAIDQSPIGRTPRSNPATYTGVFTLIRDLFAQTPEAAVRGYQAGRFSFNVVGGRCEACQGDGSVRIEMHFLPPVYVNCESCRGLRYQESTLEIHYRNKNIADILNLTVAESLDFFQDLPKIANKLKTLATVGLDYIKLGQSATTLSGGEAQRVKLATELARRATGRTLYVLDEPTTGLHFSDVQKLLEVLQKLVSKGNSVVVIEHNLDIIKVSDWIIDLGPEGGSKGGQVVAFGTPAKLAKSQLGYTSQYL